VFKDAVVRERTTYSFCPFWLQATTPGALDERLRELAMDHLGLEPSADRAAVHARVKEWLAGHAGWALYVEDASKEVIDAPHSG